MAIGAICQSGVIEIDIQPVVRVVAVAAKAAVMVIRRITAVTNRAVGDIEMGKLDRLPGVGVMAAAAGARVVVGGRAVALETIIQTSVIKINLVPVGGIVTVLTGSVIMARRLGVAFSAVVRTCMVVVNLGPTIRAVTGGTLARVMVQRGGLFMADQTIAVTGVVEVDHVPVLCVGMTLDAGARVMQLWSLQAVTGFAFRNALVVKNIFIPGGCAGVTQNAVAGVMLRVVLGEEVSDAVVSGPDDDPFVCCEGSVGQILFMTGSAFIDMQMIELVGHPVEDRMALGTLTGVMLQINPLVLEGQVSADVDIRLFRGRMAGRTA